MSDLPPGVKPGFR